MWWPNIRCWQVGWKRSQGGGNDLVSWKVGCFGVGSDSSGVFFFWRNWVLIVRNLVEESYYAIFIRYHSIVRIK